MKNNFSIFSTPAGSNSNLRRLKSFFFSSFLLVAAGCSGRRPAVDGRPKGSSPTGTDSSKASRAAVERSAPRGPRAGAAGPRWPARRAPNGGADAATGVAGRGPAGGTPDGRRLGRRAPGGRVPGEGRDVTGRAGALPTREASGAEAGRGQAERSGARVLGDATRGSSDRAAGWTRPAARGQHTAAGADGSGGYVEEGTASWYGVPFHGRQAANGEIYDMNKMTAAHRTLPFGSIVRITNVVTGLSADVRIIDRGPFVENRIIDLSRAAADAIGMVRAGVEAVRLVVLSGGNPAAGYFTVQAGAFHDPGRAERLRERLLLSYSPVFIEKNASPLGTFYRVHAGKISGEAAAHEFARKLRIEQGIVPFVVRLDDNLAGGDANER